MSNDQIGFPFPVNAYVTQLFSVPKLGYEHAAYRVMAENAAVWIDAPSAFNRNLEYVADFAEWMPQFERLLSIR